MGLQVTFTKTTLVRPKARNTERGTHDALERMCCNAGAVNGTGRDARGNEVCNIYDQILIYLMILPCTQVSCWRTPTTRTSSGAAAATSTSTRTRLGTPATGSPPGTFIVPEL